MPRPRKNTSPSGTQLSSGQAAYVLERLIRERRVSQTDINRYVAEMGREISDLEARLQRLRDAAGPVAAAAVAGIASAAGAAAAVVRRGRKPGRPKGAVGRPPGRPPGRPAGSSNASATPAASAGAGAGAASGGATRRRRSPITAEQLASRQLQGRYLALVRQIPASKRAGFARIAKEKGREAAIKEMQDSLKK
jgi:hypothetical protein